MVIEIERKFLVDPNKLPASRYSQKIKQGYLSQKPTVRIRTVDDTIAFLTIKGPGTMSRVEIEYSISMADVEQLWDLTTGKIDKIRHQIWNGHDLWEVDEFLGDLQGLWMAELELESEDQKFEIPEWAGKEVTDDVRYSNVNLAEHGIPGESY